MEVVDLALRLRRGHVLPPGKEPEEIAAEQEVWTYATATAAMLHDIGKPLADQIVTLYGRDGLPHSVWSPWVGAMTSSPGKHYRVEFRRGRDYKLHEAVTPLLATYLVPTDGMRWLGQHHDALAAWLTALGGQSVGSSVIADIVKEADSLSVGKDLSGARHQVGTARAKPLAERLVVELRQQLETGALPMNRKGAAAFVDGETVWLVSKRCLDALRESMKAQGQSGVPSRNDRLMDELQQRGIAVATGDERAVWSCEVCVGDGDDAWRQVLTLLRIPIEQVWSNPDARPNLPSVQVVPAEVEVAGTPASTRARIVPPLEAAPTPSPAAAASEEQDSYAVDADSDMPVVTLGDIEFDEDEPVTGGFSSDAAAGEEDDDVADEAESADLGAAFVVWLVDGLKRGSLAINKGYPFSSTTPYILCLEPAVISL